MAKPLPKIPQSNGKRKPKPLPKIPLPKPSEVEEDTEDTDEMIEGLNPDQIMLLAQKVADLWRDELRLEAERFGRNSFR
jgi:hypothetical protein